MKNTDEFEVEMLIASLEGRLSLPSPQLGMDFAAVTKGEIRIVIDTLRDFLKERKNKS